MPISTFSGLSKRKSQSKKNLYQKGFTIFEVLIVVSIIAVLSSVLVSYSSRSSSALRMTSTHTKLNNMLNHAKFLSIQTYFRTEADSDEIICAHGVHIDTDEQEAFIYQDIEDIAFGCSGDIDDYGGYDSFQDRRLTGELNTVSLNDPIVRISDESTLEYVVFVPPDPLVRINDSSDQTASVIVTDGESELTVNVNDEGQVSKE